MKNILAKHNFCELANLFKIKKFFKNAECKADNSNSKFNLLLDGKKIKSPSKHILEIPNRKLAQAIVDNLNKNEFFDNNRLSLLNLSKLAFELEINKDNQEIYLESLINYFKNDSLLCPENLNAEIEGFHLTKFGRSIEFVENLIERKILLNCSGEKDQIFDDKDLEKIKEFLRKMDKWSCFAFENANDITKSSFASWGILNGLINLQDLQEIRKFEKKHSIRTFGKIDDNRNEIDDVFIEEMEQIKTFYSFINEK